MARAMTAAQWQAQMIKWGLAPHYYPGWDGRGRGELAPEGIMIHHTASESQQYSYWTFLFQTGRSDLSAPLCNASTARNGNLAIGATRRANHAGKGAANVISAVRSSTAPFSGELKPGSDSVDGNSLFYGNEVMYGGTSAMSPAQYNTVVRWCAAICDFHGWSAQRIIGHREWTRRKPDPGHTNMGQLRTDVQNLLNSGGISKPKTRFVDVPENHHFFKEIEWFANTGATTGYADGTFRPGDVVLREQLATFYFRLNKNRGFKDVPATHGRYAEIAWFTGVGISKGFDDGSFQPAMQVTRDTLAAFMYRFSGSPEFTPPNDADRTFVDVNSTTPFFKEIEWMYSKGITSGYADKDGVKSFLPNGPVLREQIAAFFYRAYK